MQHPAIVAPYNTLLRIRTGPFFKHSTANMSYKILHNDFLLDVNSNLKQKVRPNLLVLSTHMYMLHSVHTIMAHFMCLWEKWLGKTG